MRTKTKIVLAVIITAMVTSVATAWGGLHYVRTVMNSEVSGKLAILKTMLDENYLYDYDENLANEYALAAYVSSLGEPYTSYYPPEVFNSYQDAIAEGYTGIGITVSVNSNNQIEIISAVEGSPAYEAGILPGDILAAVEGVEYDGSQLTEAVTVVKGGAAGTKVNITILRNGTEKIDLTVERNDIVDSSVKGKMLDSGIGYIRITSFNMPSSESSGSTSSEFEKNLKELQNQGMDRLIIDLRDNPGGVLTEACTIADTLLPEGVITYTEDKKGKRVEYKSDAACTDIPMVILINGGSASASEVLTGALKDYGMATVVGEQSYGKGIVQNVYTLLDGSGLTVTAAKYYTPSGVCIHDIGIEPDITVSSSERDDSDMQLNKAIEVIKEK